jgi:hypothetical protein
MVSLMDVCVDDVGRQGTFRVFEVVRPDIRRCPIDAYFAQPGDLLRFNPSTQGTLIFNEFSLFERHSTVAFPSKLEKCAKGS